MADRFFDQFQQTMTRGLVSLFVEVQFNGSGTPTLMQPSYPVGSVGVTFGTANAAGTRWGAKSFVRNGTGDYTLTLVDKYVRVLGYSAMFLANGNAASPISQIKVASNPNTAASTVGMGWTGATGSPSLNAIELLFFSAQGVVADPAATEMAILSFQLLNSRAQT